MAFTAKDVQALREKTGVGMMDCKKALVATDGDMEKAIEFLREKGMATAVKRAGKIASEGIVYAYNNGKNYVLLEVNCETDFVANSDQFKALVKELAAYVADNDVKDAEALAEAKKDLVTEAIGKIGEKINIRRFAKLVANDTKIDSYIHLGGKIGILVEAENGNSDQLIHDIALQIAAAKPQYVYRNEVPADIVEHEKEILRVQCLNEGKPAAIVEKMLEGRLKKFYQDVCLVDQDFVKDPAQKIGNLVKEGSKIIRFVRFEMGEGLEKKSENFAEEISAEVAKAQAKASK
ncbi:MAG: elongation factor Ts [Clostridia bacterium]|nr:elongation factor Ts [Clostridia bacterium]